MLPAVEEKERGNEVKPRGGVFLQRLRLNPEAGGGYSYLKKTVDNLPPYIILMRDKQCRFEELEGAARNGKLALQIFL